MHVVYWYCRSYRYCQRRRSRCRVSRMGSRARATRRAALGPRAIVAARCSGGRGRRPRQRAGRGLHLLDRRWRGRRPRGHPGGVRPAAPRHRDHQRGHRGRRRLQRQRRAGDPDDGWRSAGHVPDPRWRRAHRQLGQDGFTQSLTDFYAERGLDDKFPQGIIDLVSFEGAPYSVPVGVHRNGVLWSNTKPSSPTTASSSPPTGTRSSRPPTRSRPPASRPSPWVTSTAGRTSTCSSRSCSATWAPRTTGASGPARCPGPTARHGRADHLRPGARLRQRRPRHAHLGPGRRQGASTAAPPSTSWATGPRATSRATRLEPGVGLRLGARARHRGHVHGRHRHLRDAHGHQEPGQRASRGSTPSPRSRARTRSTPRRAPSRRGSTRT